MENIPEAAPQGTEAVPQTAPTEPIKSEAPEINAEQVAKFFGTDAETLSKFQKFVEANGKFESAFSKMKTDISNPQPALTPEIKNTEPTSQPQAQPVEQQPVYKTPEGSITAQEFMAKQYFQSLASEEKYAPIAKGIANGDYLKEMAAFGINATNPDGSINDQKVRMYLDLKAQTVPAQPTSSEPNMSNAPTVEYVQVSGDKITNLQDAYRVLAQDIQLKRVGQSHPLIEEAEKFIKTKGKVDKK